MPGLLCLGVTAATSERYIASVRNRSPVRIPKGYSALMIEHAASAAAVAKAAGPAISGSRIALRKLRLFGTFDPRWIDIEEGKSALTAADITDIEAFLDQRDSRALLSLLATTLLTPESDLKDQSLEVAHATYLNLAKRWKINNSSKWLDRQDSIWFMIREIYDSATPAGRELGEAALEFSDFIATPVSKSSAQSSGSARHVERVAELCSSLQRVADAVDTAGTIKSALSELPTQPIITSITTTKTATFNDLYVARTLRDKSTSEKLTDIPLGSRGGPYRAVLHGAPGAGKSTFVRNLRQVLSADEDGQAALLLMIRTYFISPNNQTILEHLHSELRASLNIEIDLLALRDALTLGLVVVIFDGLDEITDINLRVEMVGRITSFAREYPTVSMLVTSRSVGYERAPLPPESFRTLELDQYSVGQSAEYVQRWFAFIDRPELTAEFERESVTVSDLKSNPLLLSLLCVLYRERGSIPRRRRDIYAQCADLLFHTWDSHRHITQPEELHTNGDRIMQEIARWVYGSQKAQNGLSESVIQKQIGIYLHDHVGVEQGEARRRAGEFLEFCATRAWLLGVTGTEYGERVFGFTHRTFFEYFTAEAFSRRTSDPKAIAEALFQANKSDATSVLPELLLQSFDEKVEQGAASVFKEVCALSEDETLILRLMEGVPLPSKARAVGFERMLDSWKSKKHVSEASFVTLLTLNPDARTQFINDFLAEDSGESLEIFLGAWAALDLAGRSGRYEFNWGELVASRASNFAPSTNLWFTASLEAWLWQKLHRSAMPTEKRSVFVLSSTSGKRAGIVWLGLEPWLRSSRWNSDPDFQQLCLDVVGRAKIRKQRLSTTTSQHLIESIAVRLERSAPPHRVMDLKVHDESRWILLYLMAVVHESTENDVDLREKFWPWLSPTGRAMWRSRDLAASDDASPEQVADVLLQNELAGLPRWLRDWTRGKRAFVGEVFEHDGPHQIRRSAPLQLR
jgi:hypothetical protein